MQLSRFKVLTLLILLLWVPSLLLAQSSPAQVTGYVTDSETGESLIGVTIFVVGSGTGTTTNNYGYYTLTLPDEGDHIIRYSYVGYRPTDVHLSASADLIRNIALTPDNELLEGVTVVGNYSTELHTLETGRVKIRGEDIGKVPTFMGEQDIVKYLQLLPGVARGTEGFSGPVVRGGNVDENLYLLDGNPLYNVHHLMGLFSTFNADAIKTANFYKGSFPARFGGRLSSVLDVRTKEGDMQEYHGTFSIGLISSRLHLEGPIWKDRTSFSLSLRRTYLDLIAKPIINHINKENRKGKPTDTYEEVNPSYYFYDLNAKVNHKFSDRDRLFVSFYMGEDRFSAHNRSSRLRSSSYPYVPGGYGGYTPNGPTPSDASDPVRINEEARGAIFWGNKLASLGWNHLFSPSLFSNTTLYYGHYGSHILTGMSASTEAAGVVKKDPSVSLSINSGIRDVGIRSDYEYRPLNSHYIRFGLDAVMHHFTPTVEEIQLTNLPDGLQADPDYSTTAQKADIIRSRELSVYAEDEVTISPHFSANIGARGSLLLVEGKQYWSLEPRLAAHYSILPTLSAKISYAEMSQSVHLLQSTMISLPTDLWVPVTARIKPMRARQAVLGLYWEKGGYQASLEGYYKWTKNQIAYRDGAPMYLSETNWQERVAMGKGRSYGMELLFRKNSGALTGWLSYTLSWSDRLFPGGEVNNGRPFPDKYDNRHMLNIVGQYAFGKRADLSASWTLSSGNRMTIPSGVRRNMQGEQVEFVTGRNNFQMPLYHRLDLSANFYHTTKRGNLSIWNISIYNAYMHHNSFLITTSLQQETEGDQITTHQKVKSLSIFPIIPSISYTYKF